MLKRGRPHDEPSRLWCSPRSARNEGGRMRIIGCDLHARQQSVATLDTDTGEVVNRKLQHEGNEVREVYSGLPRPVLVGIEAIGPMQWFLNLLEELEIECQVGDATKIRAAEPRKQKHDRRDAELILKLLVEKRFPAIWRPSRNSSTCELCCCTAITGCACARKYRMRYRLLPWRMDCAAVLVSGAT